MSSGFFVPNLGEAATPAGIGRIAHRSEQLGFQSLWVTDRLLTPTNPSMPFPAERDHAYGYTLDPLSVLTYAAAMTSRIRLGTSILVVSYLNPVVLARQLTTLDILSAGRLIAGLGIGKHPEEFAAGGGDLKTRGRRMEEFLAVLLAIWTENPVSFEGEFFTVPESSILPKPVQRPHPPLVLATVSDAALRRAARFGAAIQPVNARAADLAELTERYREMLAAAGHDGAAAQVILRAEVNLSDRPLDGERPPYRGSIEQVAEDLHAAREAGATEVIMDPSYAVHSLGEFEDYLEALAPVVLEPTPA